MQHELYTGRRLNTKPGRGAMVNPAHPLARGLTGFWLLSEGTALRVPEAGPSQNVATISGSPIPAWVPGPRGWSLQYAGGSGDCRPGQPGALDSSIATWAAGYRVTTAASFPNLAGRQFTSAHGWTLHLRSDGTLAWRIDTTTPNQVINILGVDTRDGAPHVGVGMIDDTIKFRRVCLDGSKRIATGSAYTGTFTTGGGFASFGGGVTVGAGVLTGFIEWVATWSRVLSLAEVDWLCAEPFTVFDRRRLFSTVVPRYLRMPTAPFTTQLDPSANATELREVWP